MSCGLNRHGSHGWRKLGTCGTAKVSLLSFCHRGFPFFWRPMLPTFLIVATASFTSATSFGSSKIPLFIEGIGQESRQLKFEPSAQTSCRMGLGNGPLEGAAPSAGWTPVLFFLSLSLSLSIGVMRGLLTAQIS